MSLNLGRAGSHLRFGEVSQSGSGSNFELGEVSQSGSGRITFEFLFEHCVQLGSMSGLSGPVLLTDE